MEEKELTLTEVMNKKNELTYDEVHNMWYDWFCQTKSLDRYGRNLITRACSIAKHTKKFDPNKTYVFFKNNCPMYGDRRLYNDFRIADIDTGDVLYTVVPRDPYGDACVWGRENNFAEPIIKGTWSNVKEFFKNI